MKPALRLLPQPALRPPPAQSDSFWKQQLTIFCKPGYFARVQEALAEGKKTAGIPKPEKEADSFWKKAFGRRTYEQMNLEIFPSDSLCGSSTMFTFYSALRSLESKLLFEGGSPK